MAVESETKPQETVADTDLEGTDLEIDSPEPWEPFETQLVGWSIGIGVVGLVVFGILVNIYVLD